MSDAVRSALGARNGRRAKRFPIRLEASCPFGGKGGEGSQCPADPRVGRAFSHSLAEPVSIVAVIVMTGRWLPPVLAGLEIAPLPTPQRGVSSARSELPNYDGRPTIGSGRRLVVPRRRGRRTRLGEPRPPRDETDASNVFDRIALRVSRFEEAPNGCPDATSPFAA